VETGKRTGLGFGYLQGFDHFALIIVVAVEQGRVEDFGERFLLLEGVSNPRHEVVLAGGELLERRPACEELKQYDAERVDVACLGRALRVGSFWCLVDFRQERRYCVRTLRRSEFCKSYTSWRVRERIFYSILRREVIREYLA
jgi:hypothetical protein